MDDLEEVWIYRGYKCGIKRNPHLGNMNGYVQLPESYPSDWIHYDDLSEVEVHGGLTYGVDEDGWVGFATAHWRDIWVGVNGT